ncbi:Hypothetical protein R9X50_00126400 [Acrodontium crateriforme]|uniref:beta-glucosidase n=1 Tax=Acrodontium crateriforme TaxID=150365 RepID=A0AAQ3LYU4_9PEZI|nr:Hypothetical protein R9X50_00126400 [Acrodontium crateriforme]
MLGRSAAILAAVPLALAQAPFANSSNSNSTAGAFYSSPPKYPTPWGEGLGDWSTAYAQAQAFVSKLTLTEKVNLTTGVGWESEKCVGNVGSIPRLGFRALCMQDSPLGVRFADYASAFPAGITIAASWDREVMYQRGYDMGSEHRDKGVDVQLGPVAGPIGRSPEGGRNWEGFSPDPVLTGIGVAETVKGIQKAGVMACTKHYIGNEQEHFRQGGTGLADAISSNIDDVAMHELYLWPFADAIKAGTASIMCSYNQVNNSYACQNSYLNNYLLKSELGFQGFIMSDWGGQHSGVSSALAGLDMTMPGDVGFDSDTSFWGANLTIAVLNGTVPQWRLDDMAVRIVAGWYYVDREGNQIPDAPNFSSWSSDTYGFQHAYAQDTYELINHHVDVRGDHAKNIRTAAAKGTVLLKNNNNALPLTGKEKFTTIFGSDAAENKYGPNGCPQGDHGCDEGTLAMGWGSGTANFPYLITPLEAIKAEVLKNGGTIEDVLDDYAYTQIAALAHRADQVNGPCIVFGNSDSGEGYITVDGNEGDRNNLTLWHDADTLIATVAGQCKNTIVVMHTVGAVIVTPWHDHPNVTAIVWAALPGQESGNSLVDVLYGKVNPGGKSPFTWGATRESYGTDIIYTANNGALAPQDNFSEGIFIDYRWFDKQGETPIYEFGYGLSYTTFSYSNLQIQAHSAPAYTPTTGETKQAPTYGTINKDASQYVYPAGFRRITAYIYSFINSTDLAASSLDPFYNDGYKFPPNSADGSAQPYVPAGSKTSPGGNERLYDVLFTVTATITNTGKVEGDEVAQLYLSLGGPNDAKVVLRNFDRLTIAPGQSKTFTADITRRDLSTWDTAAQDWFISNYPKTVYVGSSSRNLPLEASLQISGTGPTSIPSYPSSTAPASSSTSASSYGQASSSAPASSSGYYSESSSSAGYQSSSSAPSQYTSAPSYQTSSLSGGYGQSYSSSTTAEYGNPYQSSSAYSPPSYSWRS